MTIFSFSSLCFGAVLGSFVNVCICRWPHDRSLLPPSACPKCNKRLNALELIPIFGWMLVRGRCRNCSNHISPVYPLVETFCALLGWLLFQRVVGDAIVVTNAHIATWVVYFFFLCCLTIMAFVDVKHHIIPDQTSSFAIPFGLLGIAVLNWMDATAWPVPTLTQALAGILLGGGSLAVLSLALGFFLQREAIGWGDVKAIAMIGCFLGAIPGIWSVLFIASTLSALFGLIHLAVHRKRDYLPFAPSLAITSAAHVLYGDYYLPWIFPTMSY